MMSCNRASSLPPSSRLCHPIDCCSFARSTNSKIAWSGIWPADGKGASNVAVKPCAAAKIKRDEFAVLNDPYSRRVRGESTAHAALPQSLQSPHLPNLVFRDVGDFGSNVVFSHPGFGGAEYVVIDFAVISAASRIAPASSRVLTMMTAFDHPHAAATAPFHNFLHHLPTLLTYAKPQSLYSVRLPAVAS